MRVGRIHRTLQEAGSELAGKRISSRDKEAMDASQDKGDDQDAVFPLLADAYIMFLAQVETELGRKFKSARDALNYINKMVPAFRMKGRNVLTRKLSKYDTVGSERTLRNLKRAL